VNISPQSAIYLEQLHFSMRSGQVIFSLERGTVIQEAKPGILLYPRLERLGKLLSSIFGNPYRLRPSSLGRWLTDRIGWPDWPVIPARIHWEPIGDPILATTNPTKVPLHPRIYLKERTMFRINVITTVTATEAPEGLLVIASVKP
jgi:hypothetical protein